ncbi:hypothetical protein F4779DRAFT_620531 [Xylariaceae sp. FL0662B]|nr:hypothetical protein F4779DRAFT_620531 [Xylariaceae sp. FL0662B]
MGSNNADPEITTIVRRYSEKVVEEMPDNTVAQALGVWEEQERIVENQATDWRDWLKFEEQTDDLQLLDLEKQCREVAETWRKFKLHCHNIKFLDGVDKPPSIYTLQKEVLTAHNKWEARKEEGFGKAKDNAMTFLEMLDGHKALFSVIPSNDKYISLFTGVVSSVVKASVNYEKIASGFSQALADISVDLNFVRKSTVISNSNDMRSAIVELYVQIFKLLCDMMIWYQSRGKRFRTAFDINYYDKKVEQKVTKIRRQIKRIGQLVATETALIVQTTQRDVNAIVPRLESILQGIADESRTDFRSLELRLNKLSQQFQYYVGFSAANLLAANADTGLRDPQTGRISTVTDEMLIPDSDKSREQPITNIIGNREGISKNSPLATGSNLSLLSVDIKQTRAQLEVYSQGIDGLAEDAKDELLGEASIAARPDLPEEIIIEVKRWIEAPRTGFLWVEGSGYDHCDSPLTFMALQIYMSAINARIPVISFFSKPQYRFSGQYMSKEEAGLVALLYSLIRQLVNLTPSSFEASSSLSRTNFERLDGSHGSIATALDIIRALLDLAPSSLVCVIDGMETMESEKTIRDLAKLVDILRDQGARRTLKVLFTTSGSCIMLQKKTDYLRERVDASRLAQSRSGSLLAGGMYANDVGF